MAKLYFRYGAMGSSKTANAIMVQYNYHERGQNALMIKPRLDKRDGERIVGSRSGLRAPCIYMEEIDAVDLSAYNCIIVDEAQFLKKEQVQRLADIVDNMDIPVICYGLRADFQGNLFEGSTWLMAWADTIEEIKTVCWCGRKATTNARVVDGKVAREGEQIVLGGPLEEVEVGKSGKPAAIAREIGKYPVLAFGNSSGDFSMLNYAEGNPDHRGMGVLVVCDDTVREYGSEEKAADFYDEVEQQDWTAISMANDWRTIYGDGVEKTGLPGAEEELSDAA